MGSLSLMDANAYLVTAQVGSTFILYQENIFSRNPEAFGS